MKTKALISFAVAMKLICAFVFAYADCWFSHVAAQISLHVSKMAYALVIHEILSHIRKRPLGVSD